MQRIKASTLARPEVKQFETKAIEVLQEYGNNSFPVDPVRIARQMGIDVRIATFTDDTISGVITNRSGKSTIYVNRNDSPTRIRFTVAHELGHFVLHLNNENTDLVDRDVDLFRTARKAETPQEVKQEFEANSFAAALLMPEVAVAREWDKLGVTLEDLAVYFQVSPKAMSYRLGVLGLG